MLQTEREDRRGILSKAQKGRIAFNLQVDVFDRLQGRVDFPGIPSLPGQDGPSYYKVAVPTPTELFEFSVFIEDAGDEGVSRTIEASITGLNTEETPQGKTIIFLYSTYRLAKEGELEQFTDGDVVVFDAQKWSGTTSKSLSYPATLGKAQTYLASFLA